MAREGIQGNRHSSTGRPVLTRDDFLVASEPGIDIGVRRLYLEGEPLTDLPILLIHGARASGIPSFDLDVPSGSFAGDLAQSGFDIYLINARNYGNSTRQWAFDQPPGNHGPLSRSIDVVRDIAAVVDYVCLKTGSEQVALMGWATGGQWMAHYAALYPDRVRQLIIYNSLWPVQGEWSIGDALEDPQRPGQLREDALPAYGYATSEALLSKWTESIPSEDLDEWRDPEVADAYATSALASDPQADQHSPPTLRTPLGAIADSFLLSRGHYVFDPARITARVLILRSELDFWSRPVDFEDTSASLVSAASVDRITIQRATHFAHLDRAECGRQQLLDATTRWLRH